MDYIWRYLLNTGDRTQKSSIEPASIFSQNEKDNILKDIDSLVPPKECQAINIIVIGHKGSGKSSLVNTFTTVLRNSGQLSTISTAYGIGNPSTTSKLFEVTMKRFQQGGKLRIFDCRGVARDPGQSPLLKSTPFEEDVMKAIGGHIKKGYEFQDTSIQEDSEFYRHNPTFSDKMHCVLFVINAEHVLGGEHDVIVRIQNCLQDFNIPIRVVLTRVDKLCRAGELNGIFKNEKVKNKVEEAKKIFRSHDCQVLPVANYVSGTTQNITQDVLALLAINNIVQEALLYIGNEI